MPDKRDMHQAKSHRNSKSTKQQSRRRPESGSTATMTPTDGSSESMASEVPGKKNKSRR